ncbi:hypothetical protein ACV07N_04880 [Roseivirga echinicomitans]
MDKEILGLFSDLERCDQFHVNIFKRDVTFECSISTGKRTEGIERMGAQQSLNI